MERDLMVKIRRALFVACIVALAIGVRWFVRTANGAKGYQREPLPRSIKDYHGRGVEGTMLDEIDNGTGV